MYVVVKSQDWKFECQYLSIEETGFSANRPSWRNAYKHVLLRKKTVAEYQVVDCVTLQLSNW
jgi:hypothetical protein